MKRTGWHTISRFMRTACMLFSFVFVAFTSSAREVILSDSLTEIKLVPYVQVFHDSMDLSPELVLAEMNQIENSPILGSTNFGFSKHFFWLKFDLKNQMGYASDWVVNIQNPHLDYVKAWEITTAGVLNLIYVGGDGMPFHNRTVQNRNVIIPVRLSVQESRSFLIQVDKRNASVSVPITLYSSKEFADQENEDLFAFGIYFGVLLVIILFSLFVFSLLQQKIFFWYAFYLIFLGLYLLAHVGILFQVAYPIEFWFNDYSRPVFITLSSCALLHFTRLLLSIPTLLPNWNKVYSFLIWTLALITIYWLATPWWHDQQSIIYLNVQNVLLLFSLITVLVTSTLTFKNQRIVVAFFWVAFFAVLGAGISIILVESGLINESFIAINPLFIGSMIEAVVFAVGLAYWSRVNEAERVKLISMVENAKKQQVDSYIKGIEKEKSAISADLHDDIGSRLSHFKRQLEHTSPEEVEVVKKVSLVIKNVRKLSHKLSTPVFEDNEFLISLRQLILRYQTDDMEINLQLFDLPKNIEKQISAQLYRIIQSQLSSIERYAKASQVDVQFFYHNAELVLAIEDNGVGFSYNKNNPGLTMKDVLSRVELIHGIIEISSSKKYGTSIMINVPISGD